LPQRITLDEFGSDVVSGISLADFENRENVWVIQCEYGPGFLFEATQPTFVLREFWRKYFQGDFAIMLFRILTQKNLTHSALADPLQDAVVSDLLRHLCNVFGR
jgi:hypothetical protein